VSQRAMDFACVTATSLRGERRSWNALRYLAEPEERAEFQVGLRFVQRTFLLCACCFGVTCMMTAALLLFEAVTPSGSAAGGSRLLYDDFCSARTNWSCTQWLVDAVLVGVVIPLKFWRGWLSSYTVPMLVLLDVFQSANLALIGCASPRLAPLCFHSFICFELALVSCTIWVRSLRVGVDTRRRQAPVVDARACGDATAASEEEPLTRVVPGVALLPQSAGDTAAAGTFRWTSLAGAGVVSCVVSSCVLLLCKSRLSWLPIPAGLSDGALTWSCLSSSVCRPAAYYIFTDPGHSMHAHDTC
jgi:hypothetical protein